MSSPRPFSELERVFLRWEKAVLTSLKNIFSSSDHNAGPLKNFHVYYGRVDLRDWAERLFGDNEL